MSPAKSLAVLLPANFAVIAAAVVRGISKADKPGLYFGEGRFTTLASCLQLLALAFFSFGIFRARRSSAPQRGWSAPHNLWLLMGAGFVFLAADDAFQIHENADKFIHALFNITHTPLTDRLDDAIIGGYLVIGLITFWIFRAELKAFRLMVGPLACGFVCGGISVSADALAHHKDVFLLLGADGRQAAALVQWADVGDGAFTLLAEGCFVAGFLAAWMMSRRAARGWEPAGPEEKINARPMAESR